MATVVDPVTGEIVEVPDGDQTGQPTEPPPSYEYADTTAQGPDEASPADIYLGGGGGDLDLGDNFLDNSQYNYAPFTEDEQKAIAEAAAGDPDFWNKLGAAVSKGFSAVAEFVGKYPGLVAFGTTLAANLADRAAGPQKSTITEKSGTISASTEDLSTNKVDTSQTEGRSTSESAGSSLGSTSTGTESTALGRTATTGEQTALGRTAADTTSRSDTETSNVTGSQGASTGFTDTSGSTLGETLSSTAQTGLGKTATVGEQASLAEQTGKTTTATTLPEWYKDLVKEQATKLAGKEYQSFVEGVPEGSLIANTALGQYVNPYLEQVWAPQERRLREQGDQELIALRAKGGDEAWGSRGALLENLARERQDRAINEAYANAQNEAYQRAIASAQADIGTRYNDWQNLYRSPFDVSSALGNIQVERGSTVDTSQTNAATSQNLSDVLNMQQNYANTGTNTSQQNLGSTQTGTANQNLTTALGSTGQTGSTSSLTDTAQQNVSSNISDTMNQNYGTTQTDTSQQNLNTTVGSTANTGTNTSVSDTGANKTGASVTGANRTTVGQDASLTNILMGSIGAGLAGQQLTDQKSTS